MLQISSYLPLIVCQHLQDLPSPLKLPYSQTHSIVCMFADVSGFTSMTESLASCGPIGAETLGKYLNSYFEQMLRLIASAGGDVFKFAGDAMIIFWYETKEETKETLVRRCLQCALRIQEHLYEARLSTEITLSVKLGIGMGEIQIIHLGGIDDGTNERMECIAIGNALEQAFQAEHHAVSGEIICPKEVYRFIHPFFEMSRILQDEDKEEETERYYRVHKVLYPIKACSRRLSAIPLSLTPLLVERMKQYVPRSVWPFLDVHEEFWSSELREITVLFINLRLKKTAMQVELSKRLQQIQTVFQCIQRCIYNYEGTINKFLIDDKGNTIVACFGLAPIAHENDPVRSILAALAICALVEQYQYQASIGITTGTAFCGIVGHQSNRREYTVLGDIVNLAARLMQKSMNENGGVITDEKTKEKSAEILYFEQRPEIMVKGKHESIQVYRPYPRMSTLLALQAQFGDKFQLRVEGPTKQSSNNQSTEVTTQNTRTLKNLLVSMHQVQVYHAYRRISLQSIKLEPRQATNEMDPNAHILEALLEKIKTTPTSQAQVYILEGEIGIGKSRLLSLCLNHPQLRQYTVRVLHSTGNPFVGIAFQDLYHDVEYKLWADMILKNRSAQYGWNDYIQKTVCNVCKENIEISRMAVDLLWHLNPFLTTDFPKVATIEKIEEKQTFLMDYFQCQVLHQSEENNEELAVDLPGLLLLYVLYGLTLESPYVFAIDNGMCMDTKSWKILHIIASGFQHCMVIIAIRTFSNFNSKRNLSWENEMQALRKLPNTTISVLNTMSPYYTEKLACELLQVKEIPRELGTILVSRTQGNPLFLAEIIREMVAQQVILVDKTTGICTTKAQSSWKDKNAALYCFDCSKKFSSSKQRHRCKACGYVFCENCTPPACRRKLAGKSEMAVSKSTPVRHCRNCFALSRVRRPSYEKIQLEQSSSISPKQMILRKKSHNKVSEFFLGTPPMTSPLKNRVAIRPPAMIRSITTSLLDQLTLSQRMILKTMSVLGANFDEDLLLGVYPIPSHASHLLSDLQTLEASHLIARMKICSSGSDYCTVNGKPKYEFTHGFIADILREQMLSVQLDKLYHLISDYKEEKEKTLRQRFLTKTMGSLPYTNTKYTGISPQMQLTTGYVQVCKHSSILAIVRKRPLWKRRFAVLKPGYLILQHDEHNIHNMTYLYLVNGKIQPCLTYSNPYCLEIYVTHWRRNHKEGKPREFILQFETNEQLAHWLYMLKYATEAMECLIKNKGDEMEEETTSLSTVSISSSQIEEIRPVTSVFPKRTAITALNR